MRRIAIGLGLVLGLGAASTSTVAGAWTFDWAGHAEVDAADLQSPDPAKRIVAVKQLAKYDSALTETYLIAALDDSNDGVRLAAATALGDAGSLAAVQRLIGWLGDPDPGHKATAATALGQIGGPDATAALTRSLGDPDPTVRQATVRALGAIGTRGSTGRMAETASVVIALIPRLEDDKSDVKLATIAQLEELGDRRAVIPMVAKFGDTSMQVRTAAVRAVGKLGDKSAVPALIRLTSDPAEDVRTAAVGALGMLGAVEAIDALTEQLATGSDVFRNKVANALAQIAASPGAGAAGEDAMRTLVAGLASPQTRQLSSEALRVAGKAAVPALVAHLEGRLAGDPTTAVKLLGENADPRATTVLAAELERGRVATALVLQALGATGDPAALVPVLRSLASKDPAIRLAAMESLRPLVATDARAGDVLVEHLDDTDDEIRVLAVEYLGILRVAAAAPKLAALTGPGSSLRLREAAIDALGEIGRPESAAPLLAVLREGPPQLHRAAATGLSYLATPSLIAPLVAMIEIDTTPARAEAIRALGAALRGSPEPAARKLLRELARASSPRVAVAAIAALAAAAQPDDATYLRTFVTEAPSDRRRAAAWALGEMHDVGSVAVLATAVENHDDRLAGDAAWALGEIYASGTAAATDATFTAVIDRLLYATRHAGWAASIDATSAVARILAAQPVTARALLVTGERRATLLSLQFHKSRLVRLAAIRVYGALAGDDMTRALAALARDDASTQVQEAVKAAHTPPVARTEWRTFYVVDPGADDAAVRQEPYFVLTPADGLVWATYTDARGHLTSEHVPPGATVVGSASRASEL